jgi:peptide/nickel transport system permease protein
MISYIIRRILLFIPTLFIISLVAFLISISAPGDPVEQMFYSYDVQRTGPNSTGKSELVRQKRHELGLDLPFFYFSIANRNYHPVIHFYGTENQYHRWISGIVLHGNFGVSYQTDMPVLDEIKPRLPWSLVLSLLSVVLAFAISIPIGLYAAKSHGKAFDKVSAVVLFMFYSLPNFFAATLLLVFFSNPQFFNWFPESGVQDAMNFNNAWPFWIKLQHWAPYLVLPLITYTYSSIAFLSRQMRTSALEILQQDYIKTARAKGLSQTRILWKHVFRNSLMPMITIFANVFPAAITGSIIIETIFALPGMGRGIYQAILSYDYPVIVAVFTIFGFLTLTGYLFSDILYAIADPRISYNKK